MEGERHKVTLLEDRWYCCRGDVSRKREGREKDKVKYRKDGKIKKTVKEKSESSSQKGKDKIKESEDKIRSKIKEKKSKEKKSKSQHG